MGDGWGRSFVALVLRRGVEERRDMGNVGRLLLQQWKIEESEGPKGYGDN